MHANFGQYRLKRQERVVEGQDGPIELSARAFDLLCVLLDRAGEVVSKHDLFAAVWPGVVVEENTLQVHISALRKALAPGMIVTVHGRGYKYAGPAPEPTGDVVGLQSAGTGTGLQQKPVIAVLPFDNLSGDPEQQYFSDGITGDIADRLTRFRAFAVIDHHSTLALRQVTDLAAIRATLKADFVVSGSVRRAGGRLRVAARLAHTLTGESIWAQHYDRPVEDLFEVQDDVANLVATAVARLLEIEITSRSNTKPPTSLSSYELLLQGHWHFQKLTFASSLRARACYERARQIDPRSADAISWLGVTYSNNWLQEFSRDDARRGAELCAEAVDLDPLNARCLSSLGFAEFCVGNLDAAIRTSTRAMNLNSGESNVLANHSLIVTYEGQLQEARQLLERALALNPVPPIWYGEFVGLVDFSEGRYEQALASFETVPEPAWDNMYILSCCGHLGRGDKALQALKRLGQLGITIDLEAWSSSEPYRDPQTLQRLKEGLKRASDF